MKFSGLPQKTNVLLMMVSSSTTANDLKVLLVRVNRQLLREFPWMAVSLNSLSK
jgi:hypothetical protein